MLNIRLTGEPYAAPIECHTEFWERHMSLGLSYHTLSRG